MIAQSIELPLPPSSDYVTTLAPHHPPVQTTAVEDTDSGLVSGVLCCVCSYHMVESLLH